MAQQSPEINRSQIIRDFVKQNPTLSIAEVVTMLGERGVTVTKNHVYVVLGKMKAKKQQRRTAAASGNGAVNAKNVSKSSAVRTILKGNRKMMAKDVVFALAEKGIVVTEGLVYYVKGKMKGRGGRKKTSQAVVQVAARASVSENGDALKTILKVKGWAAEVGGMKKLKALVEALSE